MAFLTSLPGVTGWALALLGGYLAVVAAVVWAAVFSKRPARRRAVYDVLVLIWPRRGRPVEPPGEDDPPEPRKLDSQRRRRRPSRPR